MDQLAKDKLQSSLAKNPDLDTFTSNTNPIEFKNKVNYAPLVSVDVERSFPTFKIILADNRRSPMPEDLENQFDSNMTCNTDEQTCNIDVQID